MLRGTALLYGVRRLGAAFRIETCALPRMRRYRHRFIGQARSMRVATRCIRCVCSVRLVRIRA